MKKRLTIPLCAVILAIALTAFTAPPAPSSDVYDWVSATNPYMTFTGTRVEAVAYYAGCDDGIYVCVMAYIQGTTTRVNSQDLRHY